MELAELPVQALPFGVELTPDAMHAFATYEKLLLAWNDRLALTAIRAPESIRVRHFLDSLSCVCVTGDLTGQSLVDVGAGAGFPGLPLKIAFPDMALTLVESVVKKARFLETVVSELGLQDVSVVAERAEVVGHSAAHREQYDWAVARAVAGLPALVEYLLPLARAGGAALALKGADAAEELVDAQSAIETLGGEAAGLTEIRLPGVEQPHYLVAVRKIEPTDSRYPRRTGVPSKRPL